MLFLFLFRQEVTGVVEDQVRLEVLFFYLLDLDAQQMSSDALLIVLKVPPGLVAVCSTDLKYHFAGLGFKVDVFLGSAPQIFLNNSVSLRLIEGAILLLSLVHFLCQLLDFLVIPLFLLDVDELYKFVVAAK